MKMDLDVVLKSTLLRIASKNEEECIISENTNLKQDLNYDSVMLVMLSIELEELLNISFSDETFFICALQGYGALKSYIAERLVLS